MLYDCWRSIRKSGENKSKVVLIKKRRGNTESKIIFFYFPSYCTDCNLDRFASIQRKTRASGYYRNYNSKQDCC